MFKFKSLKGTYGKPWAKLTGKDFADRTFLNQVGEVLVKAIVREAKKESAREQVRPIGIPPEEAGKNKTPAGIPKDPKFFDSFKYRIVGESTVEVYSTWEWIDLVIKGKDPYALTKSPSKHVPFSDPTGRVLFRSSPGSGQAPWIHPGFAKHSFMQKGFAAAKIKIREMFGKRVIKVLKKNSPV